MDSSGANAREGPFLLCRTITQDPHELAADEIATIIEKTKVFDPLGHVAVSQQAHGATLAQPSVKVWREGWVFLRVNITEPDRSSVDIKHFVNWSGFRF